MRSALLVLPAFNVRPFTWASVVSLAGMLFISTAHSQQPATLASIQVQAPKEATWISTDAVVEAIRDSTVSSQVPGAVIALLVQVGDRVQAGQALVRLEAQAAQQNAHASAAQVEAARTNAQLAEKELQRQQHLFSKHYISQASLDKAQTQKDAAQAQVRALQAQTSAAIAQTAFYVVHAPYAGIVSEVPIALGDMATPGRPLVRLYDPHALRISATAPQSLLLSNSDPQASIELPHTPHPRIAIDTKDIQRLPTVDAHTHTVQLRVTLPKEYNNIAPGTFARLWLRPQGQGYRSDSSATHAATSSLVRIPATTIVRRAEMTGVYVLDAQNHPRLRQVRLGRTLAATETNRVAEVEILSGLRSNERVVLDPQAAAAQTR